MDWRYLSAEESTWEVDTIEVAPALMEIEIAGPDDGEVSYVIYHNVDLLAIQKEFNVVTAVDLGIENDGDPEVSVWGTMNGMEVVVIIHTLPFNNTAVGGAIGYGYIRQNSS